MAKTATKKRKVIVESVGQAHITASFNNIIVSLTNLKGEVISWSSESVLIDVRTHEEFVARSLHF